MGKDFKEEKERLENLSNEIATAEKENQRKAGADLSDLNENLKDVLSFAPPRRYGRRIASMLPFMSQSELMNLAEEILANNGYSRGLNLMGVVPFLNKPNVDGLFMRFLTSNNSDYDKYIRPFLPFVSKNCISTIVDGYIAGNLENLDIKKLYSYLSKDEYARVTEYENSKE